MARELGHLALSDNGFLFDTFTGFTYTLNGVGTAILRGLIAGLEREDVLDVLLERYEVTYEVASRDLEQFISRMEELRLLGEG